MHPTQLAARVRRPKSCCRRRRRLFAIDLKFVKAADLEIAQKKIANEAPIAGSKEAFSALAIADLVHLRHGAFAAWRWRHGSFAP